MICLSRTSVNLFKKGIKKSGNRKNFINQIKIMVSKDTLTLTCADDGQSYDLADVCKAPKYGNKKMQCRLKNTEVIELVPS